MARRWNYIPVKTGILYRFLSRNSWGEFCFLVQVLTNLKLSADQLELRSLN